MLFVDRFCYRLYFYLLLLRGIMKQTLLTIVTLLILVMTPMESMAYGYTMNQGYILSMDEFEDLVIRGDNLKLNNFILAEEDSWLSENLNNLKFSCSARNRDKQSKHFSIMIVGFNSENEILWAMNAEPSMSTLTPNRVENVSTEVYVLDGALRETSRIWIKIAED